MFARFLRLLNKPIGASSSAQKKYNGLVFQYNYPSNTSTKEQTSDNSVDMNEVSENNKEVKGKMF